MMLKCKICSFSFMPMIDGHYIATDGGVGFTISHSSGVSASVSNDNHKHFYDAFDCPHCGCQVIAQERKAFCNFEEVDETDIECDWEEAEDE